MVQIDKKFRRELEHHLGARFLGIGLNGFVEIAVGEACSDYHLAVASKEVIHSPSGWIYKTAKNKILDEIKRLGYLYRIDGNSEEDPVFPKERNFERIEEAKLMLEEILPFVSKKKCDALLLHEYNGYTLEETAQKLNISVSMVEKRIREAKSELRKVLKKNK